MSAGFFGCQSRAKENYMHRGYRFLSSLLLTSVLAAPVAMMASPQDDKNQENRQGDNRDPGKKQDDNSKRYYDKGHKDYHTWDSNEDSAYQRYQTEHHEKRDFVQLSTKQQTVYWNWRHSNPDNK
jgi:Ni/Co efflux regulator RcnB